MTSHVGGRPGPGPRTCEGLPTPAARPPLAAKTTEADEAKLLLTPGRAELEPACPCISSPRSFLCPPRLPATTQPGPSQDSCRIPSWTRMWAQNWLSSFPRDPRENPSPSEPPIPHLYLKTTVQPLVCAQDTVKSITNTNSFNSPHKAEG